MKMEIIVEWPTSEPEGSDLEFFLRFLRLRLRNCRSALKPSRIFGNDTERGRCGAIDYRFKIIDTHAVAMYGIGEEHAFDSFGMWAGPVSELNEMLTVGGLTAKSCLIEFSPIGTTKVVYRWNGKNWVPVNDRATIPASVSPELWTVEGVLGEKRFRSVVECQRVVSITKMSDLKQSAYPYAWYAHPESESVFVDLNPMTETDGLVEFLCPAFLASPK